MSLYREPDCYETDHKLVHTRLFQTCMKAVFDGLYRVTCPDEEEIRHILCHMTLLDGYIIRQEVPVTSLQDVPVQAVPMLCAPFLLLAIDASRLPPYYHVVQLLSETFLQEFFILVSMLRSGGTDVGFDDILPEAKKPFVVASERLAKGLMKLPFERDNTTELFKTILPYNIVKLQVHIWAATDADVRETLHKDLVRLRSYYFVFFNRVCDNLEQARIICDLRNTRI